LREREEEEDGNENEKRKGEKKLCCDFSEEAL